MKTFIIFTFYLLMPVGIYFIIPLNIVPDWHFIKLTAVILLLILICVLTFIITQSINQFALNRIIKFLIQIVFWICTLFVIVGSIFLIALSDDGKLVYEIDSKENNISVYIFKKEDFFNNKYCSVMKREGKSIFMKEIGTGSGYLENQYIKGDTLYLYFNGTENEGFFDKNGIDHSTLKIDFKNRKCF